MNKSIRILSVLAGVQLVLVALVWFGRSDGGANMPLRLVEFAPASVAKLTLADGTQSVELTKDAAGWQVQANGQVRSADATQVNNMVNNLAELQVQWPVATTSDSAERFEVSAKKFQRRIELQDDSGAQLALLYTGTSPGLGKVHARSDAAGEVYAVDLANYQLPMTLDDWLDKALLALPKDLEEITVQVRAEGSLQSWRLHNDVAEGWLLDNAVADQTAVFGYLSRLQNLRVIGVAPTQTEDTQALESDKLLGSVRWTSAASAGALALYTKAGEDAEYLVNAEGQGSVYRVSARVGDGLLPTKEDLLAEVTDSEPQGNSSLN